MVVEFRGIIITVNNLDAQGGAFKMAIQQKGFRNRKRVPTRRFAPTEKDWLQIMTYPWTSSTRPSVMRLRAANGRGMLGEIFGRLTKLMQVNRVFVLAKAPYRIRAMRRGRYGSRVYELQKVKK